MKFYVLHSQHNGETTIAEYEDEGELDRWLDRWKLNAGHVSDVLRMRAMGTDPRGFPPRVKIVNRIQDFEMDGGTAIIFKGDIHMPYGEPEKEVDEKPTKSQLQEQDVYFTFTYSEDGACMRIHLTKEALLKEIASFKRDLAESYGYEPEDSLFTDHPSEGEYFVEEDKMLIIKGRLVIPKPVDVVKRFEVE